MKTKLILIVLGSIGSIVGVLVQHFMQAPVDTVAVAVGAGAGTAVALGNAVTGALNG